MGLNHDIIKAAKQGSFQVLKDLLDKGAELNTTVSDSLKKRTLLHHASQKNHPEIVEFLIKKGIPVNIKDAQGKTPLWYACEENNYEAAETLVNNGCDINITGDWNPLDRASSASYDGIEVVKLLIDNGANVNLVVGGSSHIALASALRQENIEASKLLIKNGSNVNHIDAKGETPMMNMVYFDREDHLKLLFTNNAHTKGKHSYSGEEILHHAAFGGYPGMIKILIENKASLNPTNNQGKTPLHIAVERNKPKAVKELLAANSDLTIRDQNGQTAYEIALKTNNAKSIIKIFEDHLSII
jgi:ankyrin repeat protein